MTSIDGGEGDRPDLAPVIPMFGREKTESSTRAPAREGDRTSAVIPPRRAPGLGRARASRVPVFRPDDDDRPADESGETRARADAGEIRDAAEATLLRKLRTRQLSVSESRGVLIGAEMTTDAAEALLADFERLGYLDDAALAEQLVRSAVERKGQGRQLIAPMLTRRGIPRDVVDDVVAQLPDDDLERALDFARTKARSLGARDRETALRRLLGQLARRGYPSSVSMTAARQALDEL